MLAKNAQIFQQIIIGLNLFCVFQMKLKKQKILTIICAEFNVLELFFKRQIPLS